ncbi:MAG: segregation/condensation protein A [Alphaproteobacteria bacterium]|nr:segregation/condensation protein A [Alphaproteobacteria bacterium]
MSNSEETGIEKGDSFEEDAAPHAARDADRLRIDIEGFEGPIDVLLALARDQKVDLTRISILALADQYLEFIAHARQLSLELAADYLVMAAWLAYLKSRLLLPAPAGDDEPSGAEMAAMLAFQLQRLEAMKEAGGRLMDRARLNRDFFTRGEPEPLRIDSRPAFEVSLYDVLQAYARQYSRKQASTLRIAPTDLYSIEEAVARLRGLVGNVPDWTLLSSFLPSELRDPLLARSALASTFVATLELARSGQIELSQSNPFAPLYLRTSRRSSP